MQIGPFTNLQLEEVQEILRRRGITFETIVRKEEYEAQLHDHNVGASAAPKSHAGAFQPAFTYFEIREDDFASVASELEKYGIVRPSSGEEELSAEDYICPKCDRAALAPGVCSRCRVPLLDFSSYVAEKKKSSGHGGWMILVMALILAAVLAHRLL